VETLDKINHVAVHFIIDKDGKIYQFFPLRYWAFHLGIKNSGGRCDRGTIGIEIVNVGPLEKQGENMCYWPYNFHAKFCGVDDTTKYAVLQNGWRGYKYFANFFKPQYESAAALCALLCKLEGIEPQVISNPMDYQLSQIDAFNGIFTHATVREDKTDLGKGWNWTYFNTQLNMYMERIENTPQEDWSSLTI
jgi:N-acetyl-anhydromuramyl-L-alanine amidase AmpD